MVRFCANSERFANQPFTFRIERAGRFVKQQKKRLVGQCPGNCDPLTLPAR